MNIYKITNLSKASKGKSKSEEHIKNMTKARWGK